MAGSTGRIPAASSNSLPGMVVTEKTRPPKRLAALILAVKSNELCVFQNLKDFADHSKAPGEPFFKPEDGWELFDGTGYRVEAVATPTGVSLRPGIGTMAPAQLEAKIKAVLVKVKGRINEQDLPISTRRAVVSEVDRYQEMDLPELLAELAARLTSAPHSHKHARPVHHDSRPLPARTPGSSAKEVSGVSGKVRAAGSGGSPPDPQDKGSWWHYMFSPHH
jgi:hypothetical protein